MGLRLGVILLLVAWAMVVESSFTFNDVSFDLGALRSRGIAACNGKVGDCINKAEEMMMDSEASRRVLAQARRTIGYGALEKDSVPCNRRGRSYYNCYSRGRANPYRRGCNVITRCGRR